MTVEATMQVEPKTSCRKDRPWGRRVLFSLLAVTTLFVVGILWWGHGETVLRDQWMEEMRSLKLEPSVVRLADYPMSELSRIVHRTLRTDVGCLQVDRDSDVPAIVEASTRAPRSLVFIFGQTLSHDSQNQLEKAYPKAVIVFYQ